MLKLGYSISSDVDSITMDVKFSANCARQQGFLLSETLTVRVVHHWTMKAVQSQDQSGKVVSWNNEDEADDQVTQTYLTYNVFNTRPSMTEQSIIFVYIPTSQSNTGLLKDVNVAYDNETCRVHVGRIQRPLVLSDTTSEEEGVKV